MLLLVHFVVNQLDDPLKASQSLEEIDLALESLHGMLVGILKRDPLQGQHAPALGSNAVYLAGTTTPEAVYPGVYPTVYPEQDLSLLVGLGSRGSTAGGSHGFHHGHLWWRRRR